MSVPYWVEDAVFYQIFPDRFANGSLENDPSNVQPWDSLRDLRGFYGGDLRGVIQKLDMLLELGVNAIYLNPIFQSPSTHRYNTTDYYRIDPRLGEMTDFKALLDAAHRNNMRVVLDGVFNHCGRGFFAFDDLLENQEYSPYRDWFHVIKFPVDAYSLGDATTYKAWWNFKSLPKFNTDNVQVRRYILEVARYWIEQGIDGWRLDVPNEIDDDDFWAEFRHTVKFSNPDAYLVGEIWDAQPRWVGEKTFDGLMNYPLRAGVLNLLSGQINVQTFADRMEGLLKLYPRENVFAMYSLLGSHDTERIMTLMNGNLQKVKLAFFYMLSYPGAPAIYYGDEIGLEGGKDPDCRRPFPWKTQHWKQELREWIQRLIAIRKQMPVMRRGEYARLAVDAGLGCYAFTRQLGLDLVLAALNTNAQAQTWSVDVHSLGWKDGQKVYNLLGQESFEVAQGSLTLTLPAFGGLWLQALPIWQNN